MSKLADFLGGLVGGKKKPPCGCEPGYKCDKHQAEIVQPSTEQLASLALGSGYFYSQMKAMAAAGPGKFDMHPAQKALLDHVNEHAKQKQIYDLAQLQKAKILEANEKYGDPKWLEPAPPQFGGIPIQVSPQSQYEWSYEVVGKSLMPPFQFHPWDVKVTFDQPAPRACPSTWKVLKKRKQKASFDEAPLPMDSVFDKVDVKCVLAFGHQEAHAGRDPENKCCRVVVNWPNVGHQFNVKTRRGATTNLFAQMLGYDNTPGKESATYGPPPVESGVALEALAEADGDVTWQPVSAKNAHLAGAFPHVEGYMPHDPADGNCTCWTCCPF